MSEKNLAYWESFVEEQKKIIEKNADQLQQVVNELDLAARGINPLDPSFELNNLPADLLTELKQKYDFNVPVDAEKPKSKDPSNWRQRTRAMRV